MTFEQWARDWGVPPAALDDLRRRYVVESLTGPLSHDDKKNSESWVQSEVRKEAGKHGCMLWRNNVGALLDARGVPVRYGLANDSKDLNTLLKSADLIGMRRVHITPAMVGTDIAQFVSREVKRRDWTWSGNAHEVAQMRWSVLINAWGGDAKIVCGQGSL